MLAFVAGDAVAAEEIYKVIDENGNVTYSSEPPSPAPGDAVEVIQTLPHPSEEEIEAALRRQQKFERDFARLEQQRAEHEYLRQEARRHNTTNTVIQNNTVVGTGFGHRFWHWPWVAPGAPVAGHRPLHHRRPHAKPLPARGHRANSRILPDRFYRKP